MTVLFAVHACMECPKNNINIKFLHHLALIMIKMLNYHGMGCLYTGIIYCLLVNLFFLVGDF